MKKHVQKGKMSLWTAYWIYQALKDTPVAAIQIGNEWHYDPSKDHAQHLFGMACVRLRRHKLLWKFINRN